MIITHSEAEAVAGKLGCGSCEALDQARFSAITLGAILRLGALQVAGGLPEESRRWIGEIACRCPALLALLAMSANGSRAACRRGSANGTGWGVAAWRRDRFPDATRWAQWTTRFHQEARDLGQCPIRLCSALARSIEELLDNVRQHAAMRDSPLPIGFVGYHIGPGAASFAVVDSGVGALASLRQNPDWDSLADDRDALDAIIRFHASRRVGLGPGEGYRSLLAALVDRDSVVRLGSGPAAAYWDNTKGGPGLTLLPRHPTPGFSVEVVCKWRSGATPPIFLLTSSPE